MEMYSRLSVLLSHLFIIQLIGLCDGSATLEVKMETFRNGANTDSSGSQCDPFWGTCDTFFKFCIDQYSTSYRYYHDMSQCSVFTGQTGEFSNTRNIDFSHDMNGIRNPIMKNFNVWPGGVVLKVEVWDDDSGHSGHDLIDDGIQLVWSQRPGKTSSTARYDTRLLKGNTGKSLTVKMRVWCDNHYFGPHCNVRCVPRDDVTGHYTCHSETGDKICISGWESPEDDCNIFSDDCVSHRCMNGATCRDGRRSHSCICHNGFAGIYCETNIDECSSDPCQNNGTCIDGINGYSCSCPGHFVGSDCEKEACDHDDPCQNGGTCYKDRKCLCTEGFEGKYCEINKCRDVICENGGTCNEGNCTCTKGYVGAFCGVDACTIRHCHNNGTCHLGDCNCTGTGYTGISCHVKINYCETLPCEDRGECENELLSYKCLCYYGYNGTNCEEKVERAFVATMNPELDTGNIGDNGFTTMTPVVADDSNELSNNVQSKENEAILGAQQEQKSKPMNMMIFYIIGAVVGGLILFLLLLIIAIAVYRRKRNKAKPEEEDPYDELRAPPSSMGDFQNPIYGQADAMEDTSAVTSAASTNTEEEPHYNTPIPRSARDGAAAVPVSPPSYTESQLAAVAVAHGDDDIKKKPLDSVSDKEDDNDDDVFTEEKSYVKVPL